MAQRKPRTNESPYPSSPAYPPTHNLWLKYGASFEKLQIHCWAKDWAAWRCLEIALNGRGYELVDEQMGWYETEDGELRFRIAENDEGMTLRNKPSSDWTPGEPTLSQLKIAAGIQHEPDTPHKPANETREANKRKARTKSKPTGDMIKLADICAEVGVNPRDARKLLRNKFDKPDAGWVFAASDVDRIKKLLK